MTDQNLQHAFKHAWKAQKRSRPHSPDPLVGLGGVPLPFLPLSTSSASRFSAPLASRAWSPNFSDQSYATVHLLFVCRHVEPFRSYTLLIDDGPRKSEVIEGSPPLFTCGGEKFSKASFQPCVLCANFVAIR